ncbi:MAG: 3-keto-disaccharide hydrolase [Pirellulales bacterium]
MFRVYLACLFSICFCINTQAEQPWTSLFNGKDLTGWKANVHADSFQVKDGLLVAHCSSDKHRSHLYYFGDQAKVPKAFKNFELQLQVRSEPDSNSGLFFHTDFAERDKKKHLANGYEVQINSTKKEARKTGSLYSVVDLPKTPIDDTQWNTMRILVIDKRIQVFLNDKQVIDYTEPNNPMRAASRKGRLLSEQGGAIAIQAHDPGSVNYFRDIKIRELN